MNTSIYPQLQEEQKGCRNENWTENQAFRLTDVLYYEICFLHNDDILHYKIKDYMFPLF